MKKSKYFFIRRILTIAKDLLVIIILVLTVAAKLSLI